MSQIRRQRRRPDTCRVCGCTDDRACSDGCYWVDGTRTLCSACALPPDLPPPAAQPQLKTCAGCGGMFTTYDEHAARCAMCVRAGTMPAGWWR